MTRAWGKFKPMMSPPVWVRMDTIIRASHDGGSSIKLHLVDQSCMDVVPAYVSGPNSSYSTSAEAFLKVLMRDLSATKQKALTDYTGAVK